MLTPKQMRAAALTKSDVKAEFENTAVDYALPDEFLKARTVQGLTQAQVAQRIGSDQSAVARMELAKGKHSPSLATLSKYADALECRLEVRLIRKPRSAKSVAGSTTGLPGSATSGNRLQ